MRSLVPLLLLFLLIMTIPCNAIYESTANANIFINIYKQRGDYGRLALWHEAAAECLNLISVPMSKIVHNYYERNGYEKWVERTEKEKLEIQERRQFHLKHAEAAWKKSTTTESVLNTEREKIAKFMKTWLPHYPDRFYKFGIYATFFREQLERAEQRKDYAKVLRLEAEAAEMCAAQYERIPIAYGLESYTKIRDAYLKRATLLRTLAKQSPKKLPDEVDIGKQIQLEKPDSTISPKKKADIILHTAKSDPRIKTVLANQKGVREYTWFQGFAWTVSFYNHSWGNLAIAVIDDQTGKVKDILRSKHETDKLKLVE